MLFDQLTPDTSIYMIAGYVAFLLIAAVYLVSLLVRERNLRRDIETLESLKAEAQPPAPAPAVARAPAAARPKTTPAKGGKPKSRGQSHKKATQKR